MLHGQFSLRSLISSQNWFYSLRVLDIKIDDIVNAVLKYSESSSFVEEFTFCLKGKSLPSVTRRLQLCVNSMNKWVPEKK